MQFLLLTCTGKQVEVSYCEIDFDVAPVNKLVFLTWLLWALKVCKKACITLCSLVSVLPQFKSQIHSKFGHWSTKEDSLLTLHCNSF